MKCVILAAGYATRLYPLTENFPKPLLEVGGKPILDWLVEDIDASGSVDEFVVVSNHRFAEHFQKWASGKAQKITVVDDGTTTNENRLGAVRDIEYAIKALKLQDDLFVLAGDNVLDFSLKGFIEFSRLKAASCVMCHEEYDLARQQRTAIITFDEQQLIHSYEEKPVEPKGHHAVPPFYIYQAEDAARIAEALADGCNADAPGSFAAWLSKRAAVYAYEMPGRRYDIGNMESYRHIQEVYRGVE